MIFILYKIFCSVLSYVSGDVFSVFRINVTSFFGLLTGCIL